MSENEQKKSSFFGTMTDMASEAAGSTGQENELFLTEDEADCLLNWLSSTKKNLVSNLRRDKLRVIAKLYIKITDKFPSLAEPESELLFWEQLSREFKVIPQQGKTVPVMEVKECINNELEKLNQREEFIRSRHIRVVLGHYGVYRAKGQCPVEITRRLNNDPEYRFVVERKRKLQSELTRIYEKENTVSIKKEAER